ncbi:MAG: ABC transporter ATP-binding protein, partial [Peptococcaceae bacterium]|nr:ABC transporter ATP-binding protein [Peptococcaceae bacterium]
QESRLFPWMDVAENIFVSRETFEPEEALPYLELVGLDARDLHSKPDALSGGMAHRVAIARGLAFEPDILLMDEPFAALDYFTRMSLQQKLLEIEQKTGTAIIFVTHHVDEALLLADRILVLDKGKAPIPLDISVPQPRHLEDPMMVQYKKEILDLLL